MKKLTQDYQPGERHITSGLPTHVVYCPAVGYNVANDTGWRCWLAADAEHFVLWLRQNGYCAWAERF